MWYRYYNIDIYHRRKVTKQRLKGKDAMTKKTERTEFNDEEQRRYVFDIILIFWIIWVEVSWKGVLS